MSKKPDYRALIHHAQLGSQESMNRLAKLVEDRLFAYIYRLTLDYDLAQDLLQETLLVMVKSLKELEQTDQFWCWMFRTAMGKVQHHFRDQQRKRIVQISAIEKERLQKRASKDYNDGLDNMVRKELSDAISQAMAKLKLRHRNILILRCFEQMPYSEIAVLMDSNELRARLLFFRAKMSLRKQLSRYGFSKEYLLVGLALFGLITTPAKAASATSTVTAASLEVGLVATLIGTLVSELGVALAAAIAAITLTFGIKTLLVVFSLVCFTLFCLFLIFFATIYR
ncbi:MAG: RNA polymerase sigma factor [Planctomycetota bacterium]|jgi:RNA polymerase sigma-70 factor (ECF subfamily)